MCDEGARDRQMTDSTHFSSQLKKTSEVTDKLPSPEFGTEWLDTLCDVSIRSP